MTSGMASAGKLRNFGFRVVGVDGLMRFGIASGPQGSTYGSQHRKHAAGLGAVMDEFDLRIEDLNAKKGCGLAVLFLIRLPLWVPTKP